MTMLVLIMGTLAAILFAAFRFRQPGALQGPQELWCSTGAASCDR